MNVKRRVVFKALVFSLIGLMGVVRGDQHFEPVNNTGELCTIVVENAMIDGVILQIGDEIGVYDDTLCVGAVVYQGVFPLACSGIIEVVIPGGDTLLGAKRGNPISFKIFQNSSGIEMDAMSIFGLGGIFGDILTEVTVLVASTGSSVDTDGKSVPDDFRLAQNIPNPFNPSTTIGYQLPVTGWTHICVYDMMGKKMRTLVDEVKHAGNHTIVWDGRDDRGSLMSSGPYFVRMLVGSYTETKKLLLIH